MKTLKSMERGLGWREVAAAFAFAVAGAGALAAAFTVDIATPGEIPEHVVVNPEGEAMTVTLPGGE